VILGKIDVQIGARHDDDSRHLRKLLRRCDNRGGITGCMKRDQHVRACLPDLIRIRLAGHRDDVATLFH